MRRSLNDDHLFAGPDWFSVSENQKRRMIAEIQSLPEHQVLNAAVDDLCTYLVSKYRVDVPVLDEGAIHIDREDVRVDVSRDPMRVFMDRSQPFYVSGTTIEITIPFTGEGEAFKIQPTTSWTNPPRARIDRQALRMSITGVDLNGDRVRGQIQGALDQIKTSLDRLRLDAAGLNSQLESEARTHVERRRQKFLVDQNLVASLGFPLKRRDDAPQTYRAPEVRRRVQLKPPAVTTAPYRPEPTLDMVEYEHILSVMTNMALVMERSPLAFSSMGEEDLRTHFLMQLNGHYEGQATGETFNFGGKTDILIRSDGKNIFIAECKYWSGPKRLSETVDQLLGYASWRDTKVAVVVFNRQKNFSHVLDAIPPAMTTHPNFKREQPRPSETSFRYVLAQRDDPNREMTVTVMAFDVPQPDG